MDYQIQSEEDLLQTFRPRDRKHVEVPKTMRFPLSLGYYHAWSEPSGVRVYLVLKKPEWKAPIGVSFKRTQQGSSSSLSRMCDWCHSCAPSDQIALLTATVDSRRRVGAILCLDFGCIYKLDMVSRISGMNFEPMARKLQERMAVFCEKALQIKPEI